MVLQPVLIAGEWCQSHETEKSFGAINPATRTPLPEQFPISDAEDIRLALEAARDAVLALRSIPPERIADFLETFAKNIEDRADILVETANLETALPKEPRLGTTELPRTTNQLRQAAAAARERSWSHPTIDTKANIRSKYGPLNGPIVIFGPNNFPYAFNAISGGDFAAAIAAGNPVIAKANPAHPRTTQILAEAAFEALKSSGLPLAMVQLLYHFEPDLGLALVSDPSIGATAFTGSRRGGLRLKEAADRAGKPIYLEMSSINPTFMLPGALTERKQQIAEEYSAACLLGSGQFCTNPGFVVLLENPQSEAFLGAVSEIFQAKPAGVLFSEHGPRDIAGVINSMEDHGADLVTGGTAINGPGYCFANTILRVSGEHFLQNPDALQAEAFGTVSLFVFAKNESDMLKIADYLDGNLTGAIYSHTQGQDDPLYDRLSPILRTKVGRLLNDKVPTGVAVSPAMNHGGPYPSTGHPGFTAVGIPASMLRFAALYCYDNVRQHRLPAELQNENPTGKTWRYIDGEWTEKSVIATWWKMQPDKYMFFPVFIIVVVLMETVSGAEQYPPHSSFQATATATEIALGTVEKDDQGIEMVYVPAGTFTMGIEKEDYRKVCAEIFQFKDADCTDLIGLIEKEKGGFGTKTLSMHSFWIDRYEVTIQQYTTCTIASGRGCAKVNEFANPKVQDNVLKPQVGVTWYDAMLFCNLRLARLPTEAEWEYAARGPNNYLFPWGNFAGVSDLSVSDGTHVVGAVSANKSWVGAYDMVGNAAEWTEDRFFSIDQSAGIGGSADIDRVIRGGSWDDTIFQKTTFSRYSAIPLYSEQTIGFRCVRSTSPSN